jgi:hypothetical protein
MTPKISLLIAAVGAALVFAVPPAAGDDWGRDRAQGTVRVSPDTNDYAATADQQRQAAMLDSRERALSINAPVVIHEPVVDDRFRLDPTSGTQPISVTSDDELTWPQLGLGFAIGLLLMLGLYMTLRATRTRTAH